MIKKLASSLSLIVRVLKNALLRPFRVVSSKFKYMFSVGRVTAAIPGAVQKLPKLARRKPEKREDYFDWGRIYVSKFLVLSVIVIIAAVVLLSVNFWRTEMTEYTAIYEAGESLAEMLRSVMTPEPVLKRENIGLCEPQSPEDFQLTIWIYNVEMIKDSGTRTGFQPDPDDPSKERFAPMQIKLHALISSHSKAPAIQKCADEYRILGRAMQMIKDTPSIPQEHLVGSLAEQTEPVLLEIVQLNGEELSRVWNNSSKTIRPSFGVDISQVFISSTRVRTIVPRITAAQFDTKPKVNRKVK